MAEDELYPINLLTDELRNDDAEVRIKSMQRLRIVAQALGPERTRTELIPFLNGATEDEDEILVSMAKELGEFIPLVGGPSFAQVLLDPLESLATVEETVVRDCAVEAIAKVFDVLTDNSDIVVPLLKRLTEGDWFTSRVSACALFAPAYPKITENSKAEVRELFRNLCNDDTPMVRRAAATNLGKFAEVVEKPHMSGIMLELFKTLSTDDQDSVRLLAIENCTVFGKLLNEDENVHHILPLVQSSVEDRSWRVKFSVAKDFFPLSQALGKSITNQELLKLFVQLLRDAEAEVRAAASKNVSGYIDIIGKDTFVADVLPLLDELSKDIAPNVRTAISIGVMELAPKLGQDITKQQLIPLLLNFLRDEVVDVRLNILKRLDALAVWMPSLESSLLPAIAELARDLQWRVREAVIHTFPGLAEHLGAAYFEKHILEIYLGSFTDMVGEVRTASSSILRKLLIAVGSEWILERVFPKLVEIYDKSMLYQERVNVIHAIENLACEEASSTLVNEMSKLAVRSARDKIPNVRFVAALSLEQLAKYAEPSIVTSQIQPYLADLQNDQDDDVKYYASIALESVAG